MLADFIETHRDELINRCRAKVAARSALPLSEARIDRGVSLFLDQLVDELHMRSATAEISDSATRHGHDLFLRGCTISEVVHDYGDVCQAVTDLAVELGMPISADDFRTLNGRLDDAIGAAVTEYAHEQGAPRAGESHHLWNLINIAITAFEVLQTGNVAVAGRTAAVVQRNLMTIRAALASQQTPDFASPASVHEYAVRH
jgi:hypothetical protein